MRRSQCTALRVVFYRNCDENNRSSVRGLASIITERAEIAHKENRASPCSYRARFIKASRINDSSVYKYIALVNISRAI